MDSFLIRKNGDAGFSDSYTTYGIRMGDGFLDAIEAPLVPKDLITSESRKQHGKRVIHNEPKIQARELTLTFRVHGNTSSQMESNRRAFAALLYSVFVDISVNGVVYKLRYLGKSSSYATNLARTSCLITAKFEESNPMDRA